MDQVNGSKYAPVPGQIPGTVINLGGHVFTAAPFNLDGIQEALPLLDRLKDVKTPEEIMRGAAEILILSLRRNDPELTLADLLQLVDIGNVNPALMSVCGISGIEFTAPGEPRPAGP